MEVSHSCTSLNHHWCVYTGLASRIGKKDDTENFPGLWGNPSPKYSEIAALRFGQFLLAFFFLKSADQLFYFHSVHNSGNQFNMNQERNGMTL